jgi:hypothetical protein
VVAEYAERALLMHAGRLAFDGSLDALVREPALLRAAAFEPPPVMRVGLAFGHFVRTVDDLVAALGLEGAR